MKTTRLTMLAQACCLVWAFPALGADFKSVQSGTVTMTAGSGSSETQNVTITAVDMTRAVLFFNYRGDSTNPDDGKVRGQITSTTNIRFVRSDDQSVTDLTIQWHVVEFNSGISVQRGTHSFSSDSASIAINDVDTSRSFVLTTSAAASGDVSYGSDDFFRSRLTDSNTLVIDGSASGKIVEWQVVEYVGCAVQRGTGQLTGTATSTTASPTAVDLNKSIILLSWKTDINSSGANFLRARFTANNEITIDRGANTSATIDFAWEVIEFTDATKVRSGTVNFGTSTTTSYETLNAVDVTKSVPLLSTAGNNWGGSHAYTSDDNIGPGMFTTELIGNQTLKLDRAVHLSTSADLAYYVVEFGADPVSTFEVRVNTDDDDAEEESGTGDMYMGSTDLELAVDSHPTDTVGIRFTGVTIPQSAKITYAYIQFEVDETDSGTASLTIHGDDVDDAVTFTSSNSNITNRLPGTTATASWSPVDWDTVDAAGVEQRTSDITGIVQEIVDRGGWSSGNDLALIIDGSGTRTAEAHNGEASAAPLIHIEYVGVALLEHDAGQESDAFTNAGGNTNAELFAFKLDPNGVSRTVTNLVLTISGIDCLGPSDWAGVELAVDTDGDGTIEAGETTTVGGTPTVNQAAGTITFSSSFSLSTETNYILRSDFGTLDGLETLTVALTAANITVTEGVSGTVSNATHSDGDVHDGLVAYWKLNETTGSSAPDDVGSATGTLMNMENGDWVSGRRCNALDFDGSDEYVQTTQNDLAQFDTFTVAAWFKADNTSTQDHIVWQGVSTENGWGDSAPGDPVNAEMHITVGRFDTADVLLFFFGYTDDGDPVEITTAFSDTADWHHVAATLTKAGSDTATGELWLDGVSQGTDTGTEIDVSNWDTNFRIGRPGANTRLFDGMVDDVRIYNRVLTTAEIQSLAARYPNVVDLGTLTSDASFGFGINSDQELAGHDTDETTFVQSAWNWDSCDLTNLGSMGGTSITAHDVNDSDVYVGSGDVAGGDLHAFKWTSGGGFTDLGTLTDRDQSEAISINSVNDVVGTSFNNSASGPADQLAFMHLTTAKYGLSTGMNSLGTLTGGSASIGRGVNDSGEAVGGSLDASNNMRPFIWLPAAAYSLSAGMNDLGTLGGESRDVIHRAEDINNNGETVGRSYTASGDPRAFLWLPSAAYTLSAGMNNLGVLTGGDTSFALGINDNGQVVGSSNVTGGEFHAFLWENGTMTDLNDLIDPNSSWVLIRAMDINDNGDIVGWGDNISANKRGFVLTTCYSGGAGPTLLLVANADDEGGLWLDVSDEGRDLASLRTFGLEPGERVSYRLTDPVYDPLGTGVAVLPTRVGFENNRALNRSLVVVGPEAQRAFTSIVSIFFTQDELDEADLRAEQLEMHVLDQSIGPRPGTWVPAGRNIGASAPTDLLGESGYAYPDDGVIEFWTVLDRGGVFAVGVSQAEAASVADRTDTAEDNSRPPMGFCGFGMLPPFMAMLALLCLMVSRPRPGLRVPRGLRREHRVNVPPSQLVQQGRTPPANCRT